MTNPAVIFEAVSESSVTTDFVTTNAGYRTTLSARRYGVLQHTKAVAARKCEDWITELLAGDDAMLRMPETGIEIPGRRSTEVSSSRKARPRSRVAHSRNGV